MNRDISTAAVSRAETSAVIAIRPEARVTISELPSGDQEKHRRVRDWRSTIQGFLRNSKNILKRHGTTTLQYHGLLEIWATHSPNGLTVGELATKLRVRHNTAVSVVNSLCTKKLAQRSRSEEDRRVVHVQLTSQGRTLLSALVGEHVQELDKISADLRKIVG